MDSELNRSSRQRKAWIGCWNGLSCFRTQKGKGGKRIVPAAASRAGLSEGGNGNVQHEAAAQSGGAVAALGGGGFSLMAPPSSPASFTTNSAIPSTAQSPTSYMSSLSATSPVAMYATGPYANEQHQLVSPPVFSTYTTQPSTAPLTPPPEMPPYLTTPSSPDVPFAQFLSGTKNNSNLQAAAAAYYSLYPGSPSISRTSGERDSEWGADQSNSTYLRTPSGRFFAHDNTNNNTADSNFFCPATFAQFYLDQAHQSSISTGGGGGGGRLSLSREPDDVTIYPSNNSHNNNNSKKHEDLVEEIEAYRASFGFSADEIITSNHHFVEISDTDVLLDDSFTITPPFSSSYYKPLQETIKLQAATTKQVKEPVPNINIINEIPDAVCNVAPDVSGHKSQQQQQKNPAEECLRNGDDEDIFSKMRRKTPKYSRKYNNNNFMGSCSDAEIDYRRRASREGNS